MKFKKSVKNLKLFLVNGNYVWSFGEGIFWGNIVVNDRSVCFFVVSWKIWVFEMKLIVGEEFGRFVYIDS